MFALMTALDDRPATKPPNRRGDPEGNALWRALSDEIPGPYIHKLDAGGVYLCVLAILRRAVEDLKPHNAPDIQADAADWLRTDGRRLIRKLGISRSCDDEHIRRLLYGGETRWQGSLWERKE